MPHVWSSPAIAAVPTPQAAEVCAHCGRCTSRTGHWILREPERVGQTHAQCPLSRIFRRHFRPTIDLIIWFSFATARRLANAMAAARGEAALKKTELAACAERLDKELWLVQPLRTTMPSSRGINHALYACHPSLHVEDTAMFLCLS